MRSRLGLWPLLLPAFLAGCSLGDPEPHWSDQLAAEGPCWSVNLLDGIDGTDELRDLYLCVNQEGAFTPLRGLLDALDLPSARDQTNWAEAEAIAAAAPDADLSLVSLVDAALLLIREDPTLFSDVLVAAVEAIYGQPWAAVEGGAVDLDAPSSLEGGLVVPLLPPLQDAARAILADGSAIPELLGDALTSPYTRDALCTLVGIARSSDPAIGPLAQTTMQALGEAIALSRDARNDRWSGASGDSFRDLLTTVVEAEDPATGLPWLSAGRDDLAGLLRDDALRARLASALLRLHAGDHIAPLFQQLRVMAEVDAAGTSLDRDADPSPPGARISALSSFVRLLDSASRPVRCIGIELDNLSVTLLRLLAAIDPDTVGLGVSVLGPLLDSWLGGVSLDLLELVCDGVDEQLVWDLQSVDRFNDEATGDLLFLLLELLAAVAPADGSEDRVEELVEVLALAWRAGLLPPVEESLRDVGDADFASDVAAVIPLVVDPSPLDVAECPTDSAPLDFDGLAEILDATLVGDTPGASGLDTLRPALQPALRDEGTWAALGNLGVLLQTEGAQVRQLPDLGARIVAADPDLQVFADLSGVFREPGLVEPVLGLVGSTALGDALTATAPGQPGPLPWLSRLAVSGTLDRTLHTLQLTLDWLESLDTETEPGTDG